MLKQWFEESAIQRQAVDTLSSALSCTFNQILPQRLAALVDFARIAMDCISKLSCAQGVDGSGCCMDTSMSFSPLTRCGQVNLRCRSSSDLGTTRPSTLAR